MNTPSYFEVQVDNMERASHFYQELFGWKFSEAKGMPLDYWRIETGEMLGGMMLRPLPSPQPSTGANAFVNSIQVTDIDKISEKILSLGGTIALPKFAVVGVCWQSYFLDTEGNTFGLFQPDSEAK